MLSPDVPIKESQKDILNRKSFAQSLAKVMINYSAPDAFTIGLYGPWGSGKTSVINMVLEAIAASSDDVVILRFNPWLCADSKQLITQFFKQLATAIKLKRKGSERIWQLIDDYSDILELSGGVTIAGTILSTIAKILGKKARVYTEKLGNDLQQKKNNIIEQLSKNKVKIVVSIDDIDRLSEDEIVAVFQLVKSLADFPNTMYLLAFDYDVVIKALAKVQHGDGEEYLQKIIQVPFALPEANAESIQNVLFDRLDNILSDIPDSQWDKELWVELYHFGVKPYIRSIRDVIRYTNVFSLKYELLKNETDAVDLLGLTCLQVFEPVVYQILPFYKDKICGNTVSSYLNYRQQEIDKIKNVYSSIIAKANEETKDAAGKILKLLFPNLQCFSMDGGRIYNGTQFFVHKKVAEPQFFNRYFALTLDKSEISSVAIEELIFNAPQDRLSMEIHNISVEGNIIKLLDAFSAYFNQGSGLHLTSDRVRMITSCLVKQWGNFEPEEELSFFSTPFNWRLIFCVEPLLELLEEKERCSLVEELFLDESISLGAISILLQNFERQHNRFVDEPKEQGVSVLPLEEILSLETAFSNRVCHAIDTGVLLHQDNAMQTVWLFEKISPELAQEKTKNMITDDLSLALFIHNCVGHGRAAVRMIHKTWDVDLDRIAKHINLDEAYKRMGIFIQTPNFAALPEDCKENIAAFFAKMEQQDTTHENFSIGITDVIIKNKLRELQQKNIGFHG